MQTIPLPNQTLLLLINNISSPPPPAPSLTCILDTRVSYLVMKSSNSFTTSPHHQPSKKELFLRFVQHQFMSVFIGLSPSLAWVTSVESSTFVTLKDDHAEHFFTSLNTIIGLFINRIISLHHQLWLLKGVQKPRRRDPLGVLSLLWKFAFN